MLSTPKLDLTSKLLLDQATRQCNNNAGRGQSYILLDLDTSDNVSYRAIEFLV